MVRERDPVVDIESGGSECEEDQQNNILTGSKRSKDLHRSLGEISSFEGSDEGEHSSNSNRNSVRTSDDEYDGIESLINSKFRGEKKQTKEKHKSKGSNKAPKPPRPRKGPSLNATDLQLVREISELVMKKRARVERLKALKKIRAAKSSTPWSSTTNLLALAITVVFFIVIIFHGFGSGQSSTLSDSPEPSAARRSFWPV